ncbi:hypothetical protein DL96DRAFT_1608024 [Flagelloscypha sp. PMI_526]|nr:hypothetical protein DL96DRAFT_1608024 [Flagelloscypha sp. PMI_526]
MTTRTDTARRNVASGVPVPLFSDGFEDGYDSPWAVGNALKLSDDTTRCHSGNYCGLIQPNGDWPSGAFKLPTTLTPNTDYTLTFYEYFQAWDTTSCYLSVNLGDFSIWDHEVFTEASTAPTQQTVTFSTSESSDLDMYFHFGCPEDPRSGKWFVDDVALYAGTSGNTRRRK